MDSKAVYFTRRLLLVIPTFIGITFSCFLLTQFVPGGPVEQAMMKMRGGSVGGGSESSGSMGSREISDAQREALEKHFGFDKPMVVQYWNWLVPGRLGLAAKSYVHSHKTVGELFMDRFPVSLSFGLTGFLLTYMICIPLGIFKALKNGSTFDLLSSILIIVGYAIPAFAFGMVLKMLLSGTIDGFWDVFPVGGFRDDDWHTFTIWEQVKDQFMHMVLPVLCYVIGSFAFLTLLMKNSLMEQISQDYVRTVVARGGTMGMAVWKHAFRNAMIPIATGLGGIFSFLIAGSILIEKVFNIQGLGMLFLESIVSRDYMALMGVMTLIALANMLGRIFSDFCYVLIDPRITFSNE